MPSCRAVLTATAQPLSALTTLRLGGPAAKIRAAATRSELYEAVRNADSAAEPILVLGGGSNVVVADVGFDGTVVQVQTRGLTTGGSACSGAEITVEAGEGWDDLVARAVSEEWTGVEALSGIPGTVGAVPIQNVGAYGQQVSDTISQVHAWDRRERRTRTLSAADCDFSYRSSVFKRHPGRFVIGAVTFQLRLGSLGAPVQYAELARTLGVASGQRVPAVDVRKAVLELRTRKGMVLDTTDHDTWSVGSFFTNPFVAPVDLPVGAPAFPQQDGTIKTSAAWLIERAGFAKGYGNQRVSVSNKHTLALTNRGRATTEELLDLAREIRDGVLSTFSISLDAEPVLVNCSL